jgi:hypothetical protein
MGLSELSLMNREQAGSTERRVFEMRKEGDRSSLNQGRWQRYNLASLSLCES